jgi:hypothetical protein
MARSPVRATCEAPKEGPWRLGDSMNEENEEDRAGGVLGPGCRCLAGRKMVQRRCDV